MRCVRRHSSRISAAAEDRVDTIPGLIPLIHSHQSASV